MRNLFRKYICAFANFIISPNFTLGEFLKIKEIPILLVCSCYINVFHERLGFEKGIL